MGHMLESFEWSYVKIMWLVGPVTMPLQFFLNLLILKKYLNA